MTPRTPSEEALWSAACAAEFVRKMRGECGEWHDSTLRAVMMRDARAMADWAVEAARDCDKDDEAGGAT